MLINYIEQKIKKIICDKLDIKAAELFTITNPPPHINADISTNFALIYAKILKQNPLELSNKISTLLSENGINSFSAGNGFINLNLDKNLILNYTKKFILNNNYFENPQNKEKKVIIEFVSANPTGPLHLASGSAATLGDSLANIMKICGYNVHKEYYVNDAGNQVKLLGLSLKARFFNKPVPENGYNGEYLKDIALKLPSEAATWTDEKFSKFAVDEILKSQKLDLEKFNVHFDRWFMETEIHKKNLSSIILKKLKCSNLVYEKEGAWWLGKKEDDQDKDRVLVKSDGTNTYFLNDLAYHSDKYERGFNWIIDIWGADHHGYIQRMKAGLKALGYNVENFTVLIHQLVSIKKGQKLLKMSKRAGELITLRELIEDIGVDAARFFFSMRSPNTALIFDLELARKKSNENPVYYVQYVHARINSIIENAIKKEIAIPQELNDSYELNNEERKLLMKVLWLEKVLNFCITDLSPHHLNSYLIELAKLFHSFYDKYKVIEPENMAQTQARLFIIRAVQKAIKTGLELLGISAPERM